jgi:hypothetical protein
LRAAASVRRHRPWRRRPPSPECAGLGWPGLRPRTLPGRDESRLVTGVASTTWCPYRSDSSSSGPSGSSARIVSQHDDHDVVSLAAEFGRQLRGGTARKQRANPYRTAVPRGRVAHRPWHGGCPSTAGPSRSPTRLAARRPQSAPS